MFLSLLRQRALQHFLLVMMITSFGMSQVLTAYAQTSSVPSSSGGVVTKICPQPPFCFATKEEKQQWAKKRDCKFLEDVCEKTPASADNKGAKAEDEGFWGGLWNGVKGGVVFGYEFVKGLLTGLKDQIADVLSLVTNIDEVIGGLIDLGKAFFHDSRGTLAMLAELLGQEAVDTITKATQCGAYDLGKVIGTYISPAIALKLATRLTKFSGKLDEVAKATKKEFGCASFAAGTLVLTPQGMVSIERIGIGQQVLSRHERNYVDAPQAVTNTFGRTAQSYRLLQTESDTLKLTDEHPLWVQGRGWVEAKDVTDNDVIAGQNDDTRVLSNEAVNKPIQVYNFSVANTPDYFVGTSGIWVHNATCSIEVYTLAWDKLPAKEKGFRAEYNIFKQLTEKNDLEPVKGSFDPTGKSPTDAFKAWDGQKGIDAIYKNSKGEYVIVESKATGGTNKADPEGCKDRLCPLKEGERQMSDVWIKKNLDKSVSDPVERAAIIEAIDAKKIKKVYAQTDEKGTVYSEILDVGTKDVVIGKKIQYKERKE